MKSIKKIFAGLLMATAAFGFFGCSTDDTEEDENLIVEISESGANPKTITMKAPSDYDGKTVYIVYTTDGETPNIEFDADAYAKANSPDLTKDNIREYVDYGTCTLYDSTNKPTVSSTTTFTAAAFYLATDPATAKLKAYKSANATSKTVTIELTEDQKKTNDSDSNKSGTLNFKLTKTGNSFSTHYYDTSAKTFKYDDKDNCYYQFQFSTKANGKGNWYLYIRQLGAANPIKSANGTTNFVAKGTFTGDALNATTVTAGNLEMKYLNKDGTVGGDFGTVSVTAGSESAFDLTVTADANGKTNIDTAISANDAK